VTRSAAFSRYCPDFDMRERNWDDNMAHVKKGHVVASPEWWKHLRWVKRQFWKRHRKAERREVVNNKERGN
jgi:hypothetical protein